MGKRERNLIIPPRKAKEFTKEEVTNFRIMCYDNLSEHLISNDFLRRVMEECEQIINSEENQKRQALTLAELGGMLDSRI